MSTKKTNTPIKNIIFDLGNVIVDIDFKRTVAAFQKLATTALSISVEDYIHHPIFGGLEKGKLTLPQFRNEIRTFLNTDASDDAIDKAWAAVIINSDQKRMDLIKGLGKDYRIFLLSNTNDIHVARACAVFKASFGVDFLSLFEKNYLSHQLGMAKPSSEIYEHVLADANILAQETFFIDDNGPNIEAAKKLGIQCHLFLPQKEDLCQVVERRLLG